VPGAHTLKYARTHARMREGKVVTSKYKETGKNNAIKQGFS